MNDITPFNGAAIPEELRNQRRWVNWRYVKRNGKWTKVPLNPHTGNAASCDDSRTWGTFEEAGMAFNRGGTDGIGFQLGPPYVGIDLDKCRDPETEAIEAWAQEIICAIDSYSEISPSKSGIHIFVKGQLPPGARKKGHLEMYGGGRYFTVTGQHIDGAPSTIEERPQEVEALHARIFGERRAKGKPASRTRSADNCMTDAELIERVRRANNGERFARLWEGDTGGYGSHSEADLALCSRLAFWTKRDPNRMDRLFRQSGLFRSKWDERHGADGSTYGERTIDKAIQQTDQVWGTPGKRKADSAETGAGRNGLPTIVVNNRQLRNVTEEVLLALEAANTPPATLVRGGTLARVRRDEKGRPFIEGVREFELRGRMSRVADYLRLQKNGSKVQCAPPLDVVRDVLALGAWKLPPLEGIVEVPVLRPDGTVLAEPGYDFSTHLFYSPGADLKVPAIPENPTADDVADARELIEEAIGEFPYDDEASKANALGLLLTPVLRPAINGIVPLACIDAPQQGTGKSLLATVVSIIGTGREAGVMTAPREEEEWRKRLTATLFEGTTFIVIDNVARVFDSASLASVLTTRVWKDRLLGESRIITIPQWPTWVANGNNIRLGGDIPRRCHRIRLDARTSRPWKRSDFKHLDLIQWVYDNRGALLAALLIIARSWYAAGKPLLDVPFIGSFNVWASIIGSIQEHAGVIDPGTGKPAFLTNVEQMYQEADDVPGQWEDFLQSLMRAFGDQPFTAKKLYARLQSDEPLKEELPDDLADMDKAGSFQRRLGCSFAARVGTRYGDSGIHLERAGEEKRATKWRVVVGEFRGRQFECGGLVDGTALASDFGLEW